MDIRFGSKADMSNRSKEQTYSHFVGAGKHTRRNGQTQRLHGLEVDHKPVFGRRLDWEIGRLLALKNSIDIARSEPELVDPIRTVRNQPTSGRKIIEWVDRWQFVLGCQPNNQCAINRRRGVRSHDEGTICRAREG